MVLSGLEEESNTDWFISPGSPSGGRRRVDTAVPAPVHHRLLLEVVIRINLARLRLLVLVVADASSRGCPVMCPPSSDVCSILGFQSCCVRDICTHMQDQNEHVDALYLHALLG